MNCLKIKEIKTVRDLISYTKEEVKKFKNLGAKSLEEIVNKVEELGLEFKKEDKPKVEEKEVKEVKDN